MITVVGGVYLECCIHPSWREVYGSAGRAASALAALGDDVQLHSAFDSKAKEIVESRAAIEGFAVESKPVEDLVIFSYMHDLATPSIVLPKKKTPQIEVDGGNIVRFGMIEGDAVVNGHYVVYDPQNVDSPKLFATNGSQADHLAMVLNRREATILTGGDPRFPERMAKDLVEKSSAEVVVIKLGALGALVFHDGQSVSVPAFKTETVWTIGSGDVYVAHFAHHWINNPNDPVDAARKASIAASYYCWTKGFPTLGQLDKYSPDPIVPSERFIAGYQPTIYLAGPFFTLAQRWLVEQARNNFLSMGMKVFSPVHDVGFGVADDVVQLDLVGIKQSDVLFAIIDGLDSGTIYEVGYARALGIPVIVYCENEKDEDKKMMEGSDCIISKDYTTALYHTLWEAISA